MFISGTSTHRVGKVAEKLLGVAPSASAVSRLNQTLTKQYEAWRERPLLDHYRIIYLDGIHFTVRHGTQTDATMILTALGVDLEGSREVLAFRACAEESKEGWSCLLQDLRSRGVTAVDLLMTDGYLQSNPIHKADSIRLGTFFTRGLTPERGSFSGRNPCMLVVAT